MIRNLLQKIKLVKLPKIPPALIRTMFIVSMMLILGGGGTGIILFGVYKPKIELLNSKDPDRYAKMTESVKNLQLKKALKLYQELDALTMDEVYELRYTKWIKRWEEDKEFRDQSLQTRYETNQAMQKRRQEKYAQRISRVDRPMAEEARAIREMWDKSSHWEKGLLLRAACVHFLHQERQELEQQKNAVHPAAREPFRIRSGFVSGQSESKLCNDWVNVSHDPEALDRSLKRISAGMNYYYFSRLIDTVGLPEKQIFSPEDRATRMAGDFETF